MYENRTEPDRRNLISENRTVYGRITVKNPDTYLPGMIYCNIIYFHLVFTISTTSVSSQTHGASVVVQSTCMRLFPQL